MRLTGFRLAGIDFLLITLAYFLVNQIKRGSFDLQERYELQLVLFYACWMGVSLLSKKFQVKEYRDFRKGLRNIIKSNLYLLYCITFLIVFCGLSHYSRVQVFATCLLLFVLNAGVWLAAHRWKKTAVGDRSSIAAESAAKDRPRVNFPLVLVDLGLLLASFWAVNYLKRGSLDLPPNYDKLLLIIIGLWFFSALATRKFVLVDTFHIFNTMGQWVKAGLMTLASLGVAVFALRLFYYSRFQGFGTIGLLMVLEVLILGLVLSSRKARERTPDVETLDQVQQLMDQAPVDTEVDIEAIRKRLMAPAGPRLQERLEAMGPDVFRFVSQNVPLDEILWLEAAVEHSCEPFGRNFAGTPMRVFVNLHKLNDARRINAYSLEVYRLLLAGSYFVGYAHTIRTHYNWVYKTYPRMMAHLVYGISFVWRRVIPKLPWIKKLYFAVTRGKNRIISRAELLGRLSFCGFEIVDCREMDLRFWFVAKKMKMPSYNTNPTYGPLVILNRVGYQGQMVPVYKFRTMHPYSEFLQDYVFAHHGLQEGGKLKDDFRVTTWGKVFRKLWIDELPMLYNWIRGDLQLVGVRPLSKQYLGLYSPKLRELRKKVKPGLLPPFYADMPKTLDEIMDSECRYIKAYLKHPFRTQIVYFFKCVYNIAWKRARSG